MKVISSSANVPQRNESKAPSRTSSGSGLMSFSKRLAGFLEEEHLLDETMHVKKTLLDGIDAVGDTFHTASTTDSSNSSSSLGAADSSPTSDSARKALKDFELQLKFYGKECLDEEVFAAMLDDMEYTRDRSGLFERFLEEVASCSPVYDESKRCVTVEDMGYLYLSEPYSIPLNSSFASGDALLGFAEQLFRKADESNDGFLDLEATRKFFKDLFWDPTDEELREVFDALDQDGDGMINLDEFKSFIVKANVNDIPEVALSDFNDERLMNPRHSSDEEFVTELERYAKNHQAVSHHLLANLACASFGKKETADMILRFLSAYKKHNSHFIDNVKTLIGLLKNEEHAELLKENLEEELGQYDEDMLKECEAAGITRESVEGIPHSDLFCDLVKHVESTLQRSHADSIPKYVYEDLVAASDYATKSGKPARLLAALYFGAELIVPEIYSPLLEGMRNSLNATNEEARFLLLHIDLDKDHANVMRDIVLDYCKSKTDRLELFHTTKMILDARATFYDRLLQYSSADGRSTTSEIYDKQSNGWKRDAPTCLSDFTGRPVVFEMCEEHVDGAVCLDLGCGEGYVARKLTAMGSKKIVGIDISPGMVEAAKTNQDRSKGEFFIVGDVSKLKRNLLETTNETNIMPGAGFDCGLFDLSVAVFVFNYMNISSMSATFRDVFSLLKPGGHFVLSVPHPSMTNHDGEIFGFNQTTGDKSSYFSLRDQQLEGHISTINGDRLKVRMFFKTFDDYIETARAAGFEIVQVKEARVQPEHLSVKKDFFESLNDKPLHLVFKLRKPQSMQSNNKGSLHAANTLNTLPKRLNWPKVAMRNPANAFQLIIPDEAVRELTEAAIHCYENGISVNDLQDGTASLSQDFVSLRVFAHDCRMALLHETGLVLLKGLDLGAFSVAESERLVVCSRLAYYILCDHVGQVDSTARGCLFDVKDTDVDAAAKGADNVLFSVSNCEADFHTDGASKDRVYDAVGLLCIHPSSSGGKSKLSNASMALDNLGVPKFIMHELLRPTPRDVLENGGSKVCAHRKMSMGNILSRNESIMSLRITYNSYPIFSLDHDRMRFRYMRHWIETAHRKLNWDVPTLLKVAMDCLDDKLNKMCCFDEKLDSGDIMLVNNAVIAHARDAFKDVPGEPKRHLVRCWMELQMFDLGVSEN